MFETLAYYLSIYFTLTAYTLFYICYMTGVILMEWLLNHWDIITLLVTNIAALFVNPPKRKR